MMSTTMGVSAALRLRLKKFVGGIRFLLPLSLILFYSLSPITCSLLRAQTETATLSGIIQDPKGGVVPGVEVTLTRIETGTVGTTTTNGAGIYVFTGLEPGHFRLLVRKEGFKEISIKEFELHVQDKLEQNFSLEIGSISERVTVEGNGLVINTADATVGTVIDRNFAENLPLNGRSFQTLILLTPGTVIDGTGVNGGTFSVNGQRENANSFTVDGVSASLGGYYSNPNSAQLNGSTPGFTQFGTTQGMVSVDALQEFKIQTSTYSPEYGRQPGGQISLLTRSGTNAFHGTAFDYLRNDIFDANTWFNDATIDPVTGKTLPKGRERQNDFGGTLGGPIFKDKTFFFFSYEGLRLLQPHTEQDVVPSLQSRQQAAASFQPLLNSFPLPNPTGNGSTYTLSQSFPTNLDSFGIKIDHRFGQRLHLFGRYSDTESDTDGLSGANVIDAFKLEARGVTLGAALSIRPNLANEFRVNYGTSVSTNILSQYIIGGAKRYDTSILCTQPVSCGSLFAWDFSLPEGFLQAGSGPLGKTSERQINVVDNVSYSVGRHQTKFGIDYRRLFPIAAFTPVFADYAVLSMNDLQAGTLTFAFIKSSLVAHPIYTNFSSYAQDSWRVSSRVSLTYGLRWELNPPPGERDGIQPLNIVGINNPATATLAPLNSALYKTTYNNFAPRVGLAYQIGDSAGHQLVVRAGFGMFYDLNSETAAIGFGSSPFFNRAFFTSRPGTANPLPFPVPNNALSIPPVPSPLTAPYNTISAVDPNLKLPYTLQWNVSIERGLGQNQSLVASYVASSGSRLLRSDYLFNFNPNTFQDAQVLRNASSSNFQSLQLQFNRRLLRGLQALASYTYAHSIDNASDGQIVYSAAPSGSIFLNPNIDKGNSQFDQRHAFRAGLTYGIPTWKASFFTKAVLGGWSVQTITIAQTGLPADLIGARYFPSGYTVTLRPNLVPGVPLYVHGPQYPGGRAFNSAVIKGACPDGSDQIGPFCPVPADTNGNPTQIQGTLGRNVLRGFRSWQADFALHRQFNFTERVNLQFRSEFFNVFNHPNFSCVDNNIGDSTFGQAQCTLAHGLGGVSQLYQIGGPRSIQMALKLQF